MDSLGTDFAFRMSFSVYSLLRFSLDIDNRKVAKTSSRRYIVSLRRSGNAARMRKLPLFRQQFGGSLAI